MKLFFFKVGEGGGGKKSIYFKQDFKNLCRFLTNYTDSHQGTLDPDIMISVANILTTGIKRKYCADSKYRSTINFFY